MLYANIFGRAVKVREVARYYWSRNYDGTYERLCEVIIAGGPLVIDLPLRDLTFERR